MPADGRDPLDAEQTRAAVVCLIVAYSVLNLFLAGVIGGRLLPLLTFAGPPLLWMLSWGIGSGSRQGPGFYLATFAWCAVLAFLNFLALNDAFARAF